MPAKAKNYTVEYYKDKKNEFRTRIIHPNGNILFDSGEGYKSARTRERITYNFFLAVEAGHYKIKTINNKTSTKKGVN